MAQVADRVFSLGKVLPQLPQLVAECGLFCSKSVALGSLSIQLVLQLVNRFRQFGRSLLAGASLLFGLL